MRVSWLGTGDSTASGRGSSDPHALPRWAGPAVRAPLARGDGSPGLNSPRKQNASLEATSVVLHCGLYTLWQLYLEGCMWFWFFILEEKQKCMNWVWTVLRCQRVSLITCMCVDVNAQWPFLLSWHTDPGSFLLPGEERHKPKAGSEKRHFLSNLM